MDLLCFIANCKNPVELVMKSPDSHTVYKPLCRFHHKEILDSIEVLKRVTASGSGTAVTAAMLKTTSKATTMTLEEYDRMLGI
jgi:hypothetical protein